MGDDDKLATLVKELTDIRVELERHIERQAAEARRLEEREEMNYKLLRADLEGYLRGRIDSVNENINATHRDLSERLDGARGRAWALFAGVTALGITCAFLGALVAALVADRFGFVVEIPNVMP